MQRRKHLLSFFSFFLVFSLLSGTTAASSEDACDPRSLPDPLTFRPDQLTVLISGYSERRLPLLRSLAAGYASLPSVAAVIILWGNPSTPSHVLSPLLSSSSKVTLVRDPSPSLNARFLPRAAIRTRAVAVCDDDVEVDHRSLALAFAVWRSHEHSLVGFFARSHDLDLARRTWIYTIHPDRYSIVLTKFMILGTDYLHRYSCWTRLAEARRLVDRQRNCEDILMNFVVAMAMAAEGRAGPVTVLVEGRRVRDWGDPRNSGNSSSSSSDDRHGDAVKEQEREREITRVGLSARADHRKRRGDCIREFHRMLRVMPLRYSYGKVVEGLGEQGLCLKGAKLVFCDRD
ncbi:glycosyltransferase family protein 64 C3 [Phoenix dactylifera]|uniref:Glycosyltransferase family protein 64 C3 n=1 Tax=Phoenix dactylifera TaxID=42345 RepID=A0A8B7CL82_PHODC|nr:glycosyltransferase family protein 64 C3 [Phoenix dactylifera]